MFDLIYPIEPAPQIPSRYVRESVLGGDNPAPVDEMLPVVRSNGIVVGMARRSYCHSGVKVLHPVVHLQIIDRYGGICLQKRSMTKDIQPGRWDTAVGGHVDYGETLLEALYRESWEELGLRKFNPVYMDTYVYESEIEQELVNIFAAVGSYRPTPNRDEVDEVLFWEFNNVVENLGNSVFTPNFEHEFQSIKDRLTALL